jgi:hypothetical protein
VVCLPGAQQQARRVWLFVNLYGGGVGVCVCLALNSMECVGVGYSSSLVCMLLYSFGGMVKQLFGFGPLVLISLSSLYL